MKEILCTLDAKEVLVTTDEERKTEIMKEMHTAIVGGVHNGQTATIAHISERYWWAGIAEGVRALVRSCEQCQRANPLNRPPAATLHPIAVKHVFHRWGIDLIGPLKVTEKGNKYIVVATEAR